jgi:hypothetical protein
VCPCRDQRERCHHAQDGYEQRGQTYLEHLAHGGFEPDLEQQDQHAQLGEHVHGRVGRESLEPGDAEQMEIAQHDSGHQLAQHRRLSDARGQIPAELRTGEDHGQGQDHGRDGVGVAPTGALPGRGCREKRDHRERARDVGNATHTSCEMGDRLTQD